MGLIPQPLSAKLLPNPLTKSELNKTGMSLSMKATAIIVAGGSGVRMKAATRKQYLKTASGLPILTMTLMPFDACDDIDDIILVVPGTDINYCRENILSPVELKTPIRLVPGGRSRQESVFNGLKTMKKSRSIAVIHDGVRPFVVPEQITACCKEAATSGACILGISASDTLKQTSRDGYIEKTLERDCVWLAQTPQAFQCSLILKAHASALSDNFKGTDDASLVERLGKKIRIIPGSRKNIKITVPEDLAIAEAIIHTNIEDR
jgi:2-C-methyl-D-erythritol 4-phosphate cytidylyltransferase